MKFFDVIHATCLSAALVVGGCGDDPEIDARKLEQVGLCKLAVDGEFGGPIDDCEVIGLSEGSGGDTGDDSSATTATTSTSSAGTTWDMGGGASTLTDDTGWPGFSTGVIDPTLTTFPGGEGGSETSGANSSEPGNSTVADTEFGTDSGGEAGGTGGEGGSESDGSTTASDEGGATTSGGGDEGGATTSGGGDEGGVTTSGGGDEGGATTSNGEGGGTTTSGGEGGGTTSGGEGGTTTSGGEGGGDTGGGDEGGDPPKCATHWAQAPRATSTAHIDGFNPLPEVAAMIAIAPWAARAANPVTGAAYKLALTALITGLATSANPAPPATFSPNAFGNGFAPWRNSKEYRGYIDMFQFKVRCDSKTGKLIARQGTPGIKVSDFTDGQRLWSSHGFTKLPGPVFQGGEPPAVKPWTNILAFGDAAGANVNTCVTNFGYIAARIGAVERAAAFPVLGFDAPFIWEDLSSTVCCDGSYDVRLTGSHFPTMSLYINYDRVKFIIQTALPAFIASGAPALGAVGVGPLAGAGLANKVVGKARMIDDCNGQITQEFTPKPSKPL